MSKAFLIVLLILVVLFLLLYPFLGAMLKDKRELAEKSVEELFPFFFNTISAGLFEGKGEITQLPNSPRAVNMMSSDPNCQNMIMHFMYSTGNMIMELGFKYYQEELRFQHTAYGLRNSSAFTQKDRANEFVEIARQKIYNHKITVVKLLNPDEVISHISVEHPFDLDDPFDMVESSYGDLTVGQKEALIWVGSLISCADGSPESFYLGNPAVLQQIRFFNVSWDNCKSNFSPNGEAKAVSLLSGIDKHEIAMLEPFFSAITTSPFSGERDSDKMAKFYEVLNAIGISNEEYDEIALKNKLLMEMFCGK